MLPLNTPLVYIILLNYNSAKDTLECLKSIQGITYQNYKVIIIDNNSTDHSEEIIKKWLKDNEEEYIYFNLKMGDDLGNKSFLKYTFIQSGENRGYGAGNNIGIRHALAKNTNYVLILNNDTVVEKGFLEPLVDSCERDSNIGISSSKIYFYDRPNIFWFNGGSFNPYSGRLKHYNYNEIDIGQINKNITFITGCLWLIPSEVLKKIGLIDENFFMYYEDLEFCRRVSANNYKLVISIDSKIYHKVVLKKGSELSEFSVYWRTKNALLFMNKYSAYLSLKCPFFFNNIVKVTINILRTMKLNLFLVQIKAFVDHYKKNNDNN